MFRKRDKRKKGVRLGEWPAGQVVFGPGRLVITRTCFFKAKSATSPRVSEGRSLLLSAHFLLRLTLSSDSSRFACSAIVVRQGEGRKGGRRVFEMLDKGGGGRRGGGTWAFKKRRENKKKKKKKKQQQHAKD